MLMEALEQRLLLVSDMLNAATLELKDVIAQLEKQNTRDPYDCGSGDTATESQKPSRGIPSAED